MAYGAKNFDHLLGTQGFSDKLLQNHFKLYRGYVTNVNKLGELSLKIELGTLEYAELKRRFGWEFSGMRLHELYFGNMKNGGAEFGENSALRTKIAEDFGSHENWEKDFK